MKNSEFIKKVAADVGDNYLGTAEKFVNAVFDRIKLELAAGNEIAIKNFGVFRLSEREGREGTNPRTHEKIQLPAYKLPVFKVSSIFKKSINSGETK